MGGWRQTPEASTFCCWVPIPKTLSVVKNGDLFSSPRPTDYKLGYTLKYGRRMAEKGMQDGLRSQVVLYCSCLRFLD